MTSKKSSRQEIIIGAFVLIAMICLIIITINLGTFSVGEKTYHIRVRFRFVSGLEVGAPAKVYGTSAGQITNIEVIPGDRPVEVTMRLSDKYKIHKNARIKVTQFGIMGEKVIDIDLGSSTETVLGDGAVLNGIDPLNLEEIFQDAPEIFGSLTNIIGNLNKVLGTEEVRTSIQNTIKRIDDLTLKFDNILGTSQEDVGDLVKSVKESSLLLEETLTNLNDVITRGKEDYISAGKNLNATMETIRKESNDIVNKTENLLDRLDKLSSNANVMVEENREGIKASINAIKNVAEKIDTLIGKIEKGEGTLSLLINDPDLYDELVNSVKELSKWVNFETTTDFPDRIRYEKKNIKEK